MDEQGILVNQLEDLDVDIAHISPSHHFPTGIIMPYLDVMNYLDGQIRRNIAIL